MAERDTTLIGIEPKELERLRAIEAAVVEWHEARREHASSLGADIRLFDAKRELCRIGREAKK